MDEPFIISVIYQNKEYRFDAQLFASTYNYRIEVMVNEVLFNFERDDEGGFRAIAATPDDHRNQRTDARLLQEVANALEEILS